MYSFPLLSVKEILQCLRELDIDVREEELLESEKHRDAIRLIVEALMAMCLGVTRAELEQETTRKVSVTDDLDVVASVVEVRLFRCAASMMKTCGVEDYSLRDWLAPEPKRLRRNLSAVINFAKFREEELMSYKKLCDARDETLAQLALEEDELQQTMDRASEAEQMSAVAEVSKARLDCDSLDDAFAALQQRERLALQKRDHFSTAARLADDEKADQEKELHFEPTTTENKPWYHNAMELVSEAKELRDQAEQKRRQAGDLERDASTAEALVDTVRRCVIDVDETVTAVEDIETHLAKHKAHLKDLKATTTQCRDLQRTVDDLRADKVAAEKNTASFDHRLGHLKDESAKIQSKDLELVAGLQDDLRSLDQDYLKIQTAQSDLNDQRRSLERDHDDSKLAYDRRHSDLIAVANDIAHSLRTTSLCLGFHDDSAEPAPKVAEASQQRRISSSSTTKHRRSPPPRRGEEARGALVAITNLESPSTPSTSQEEYPHHGSKCPESPEGSLCCSSASATPPPADIHGCTREEEDTSQQLFFSSPASPPLFPIVATPPPTH